MNDRTRRAPLPLVSSCEGCGACCAVVVSPPFYRVFDGDGEDAWERLRRDRPDLVAEVLDHERRRREEGCPSHGDPCLWYDPASRLCRHHDLRPRLCRAFEVGGVDCLDARRRAGVV